MLGLQARPPKPTTAFALEWGPRATANLLDVDAEERERYVRREPLYRLRGPEPQGPHAIIRHGGYGLGMARVRGRQRDGTMAYASLYPKAWITG
ncbi:MAG: hypothetical protein U5L11_08875 [Arhodomonas sp.]|nr:hypothetical protein [Arhodomonas sp.]